MGTTGFAATLAFVAGLCGAIQIAAQGRLADRVGSLEALGVSVVVAGVTSFAVILATRRTLAGVREGFASPKWMLIGGLMSVTIVLSISIAGPRIGAIATSAFLIVGQFGLAAAIDRLGLFGFQQLHFGWPRVLGLALLAAGAALTLRR
jgi:bacterial/archaeal transporter family-2 protein